METGAVYTPTSRTRPYRTLTAVHCGEPGPPSPAPAALDIPNFRITHEAVDDLGIRVGIGNPIVAPQLSGFRKCY